MKPMTCDDVRIANQFAREGEDQHFIPEIQIPSDLAAAIDELDEIDDKKDLDAWEKICTDRDFDQAFIVGYRLACLHIATHLSRFWNDDVECPPSLENFIRNKLSD